MRSKLLFAALVVCVLATVSARGNAQGSCQTGQTQIVYPGNNNTIPSTFTVQAYSSTEGGCKIKDLRLYVDGKNVYNVGVSAPSAGFSYSYTFTQGYHKLVALGYNNEGYAFASPAIEIFAAPKDQTVYITSPPPNQVVNDTVTVKATVRWDKANISHMRAYVDNHDVYDAKYPVYNSIRFQKGFSSGTHYLVVIAWDNYGRSIKSEEYFTVQ